MRRGQGVEGEMEGEERGEERDVEERRGERGKRRVESVSVERGEGKGEWKGGLLLPRLLLPLRLLLLPRR